MPSHPRYVAITTKSSGATLLRSICQPYLLSWNNFAHGTHCNCTWCTYRDNCLVLQNPVSTRLGFLVAQEFKHFSWHAINAFSILCFFWCDSADCPGIGSKVLTQFRSWNFLRWFFLRNYWMPVWTKRPTIFSRRVWKPQEKPIGSWQLCTMPLSGLHVQKDELL